MNDRAASPFRNGFSHLRRLPVRRLCRKNRPVPSERSCSAGSRPKHHVPALVPQELHQDRFHVRWPMFRVASRNSASEPGDGLAEEPRKSRGPVHSRTTSHNQYEHFFTADDQPTSLLISGCCPNILETPSPPIERQTCISSILFYSDHGILESSFIARIFPNSQVLLNIWLLYSEKLNQNKLTA